MVTAFNLLPMRTSRLINMKVGVATKLCAARDGDTNATPAFTTLPRGYNIYEMARIPANRQS
jgi:hypothetical protein